MCIFTAGHDFSPSNASKYNTVYGLNLIAGKIGLNVSFSKEHLSGSDKNRFFVALKYSMGGCEAAISYQSRNSSNENDEETEKASQVAINVMHSMGESLSLNLTALSISEKINEKNSSQLGAAVRVKF